VRNISPFTVLTVTVIYLFSLSDSCISLLCAVVLWFLCFFLAPLLEAQCSSDYDCPNEKACVGKQCVDPCTLRGACGENALCRTLLHKPRCSCPQCYVGMPLRECRPDPKCVTTSPRPNLPALCQADSDCPESLSCNLVTRKCSDPCHTSGLICDSNKKCEVRHHRAVCVCKAGFVVSEEGVLMCAPERVQCSRDDECASNLACVHGKCQNPCTKRAPCPASKTCEVLDHKPVCICTKDCHPSLSICLRDNGCPPQLACHNYRCTDPCQNFTCPQDAPCFVEHHRPVCKFCPSGFVSDQKSGCIKGKIALMEFVASLLSLLTSKVG